MNAVNASARAGDPTWAPLVDVSGMPIADLQRAGDTVLGRCIERLIRSLDDPNGVISAFGSFISDS